MDKDFIRLIPDHAERDRLFKLLKYTRREYNKAFNSLLYAKTKYYDLKGDKLAEYIRTLEPTTPNYMNYVKKLNKYRLRSSKFTQKIYAEVEKGEDFKSYDKNVLDQRSLKNVYMRKRAGVMQRGRLFQAGFEVNPIKDKEGSGNMVIG